MQYKLSASMYCTMHVKSLPACQLLEDLGRHFTVQRSV